MAPFNGMVGVGVYDIRGGVTLFLITRDPTIWSILGVPCCRKPPRRILGVLCRWVAD